MPKKILLADDSITIQKVVELTFSDGDYEVTAVNNGARAIQKLSEMRPDIILSDIIMPEKNGYEVCEFVKSHPEFRNIPVVLLTGTFEPFDPDRADKAGCDAVVTKPFESQSLIHKVEELIESSRTAGPAQAAPEEIAAAPEADEPTPWVEEAPAAPAPSAFSQGSDMFGGAMPPATAEMLFNPPAEEPEPEMPAPTPAPSPWNEQPAAFSAETRAFSSTSFEDVEKKASREQPAPAPAPAPEPDELDADSPFGASPPAETFSGETRAFPRMSFEDLQSAAGVTPAPIPVPEPAAPPPPPEPQPTGGETRAFPRMSFDDLQKQMSAPAPAPEPEEPSTSSLWDEAPAPVAPAWSAPPEPEDAFQSGEGFSESTKAEEEPAAPAAHAAAATNGDLTDEQIDRIARRVVQLMSDQVVRNIAWEVIPDLAEMVVKERIRQLETES
ncbi:MAG TPA: response regulator [Thermoanaerobaculia bacterium]|nr:response regulator [Thermoanaerobaculia bacterium]